MLKNQQPEVHTLGLFRYAKKLVLAIQLDFCREREYYRTRSKGFLEAESGKMRLKIGF